MVSLHFLLDTPPPPSKVTDELETPIAFSVWFKFLRCGARFCDPLEAPEVWR